MPKVPLGSTVNDPVKLLLRKSAATSAVPDTVLIE